MDPRLGTDTSGPGEAVLLSYSMENLNLYGKIEISEPEKKSKKSEKSNLGLFGGKLEMSSV